ncbi:MAG: electron transfer flavoprotein subunit alpha/FixB family protein [Bacteroidota bacterium]
MSVIVFVENANGKTPNSSLEAVSYASSLGSAVAIACGSIGDEQKTAIGNAGASKILNLSQERLDGGQWAKAIAAAVEKEAADTVVIAYDLQGKEIAPRVSARIKAGLVAGAVAEPAEDGSIRKSVFSGKAFANYQVNTSKKVIGLTPNSGDIKSMGNNAEIEVFSPDVGSSAVQIKEVKKQEGDINLPEAELVVSAGRGLKGPENWGMVEDLAQSIGAATACSRPVADIGWRPHHEHVGQTGVAIRPNLYIAIGISGAIQHLAGVNQSKTIVVVNTDPEAPFFKAADFGIVGDAFEVIPKLTEAIKAAKN